MSEWATFYVIVGSSGAALIGLQFVVITLIASMHTRATPDTLSAFGTPTVVHLAGALLVSAVMSVPWHSLGSASIALLACGVGGFGYCVVVIRRARHQTTYKPVLEDWVWYAALPCVVYAALALAAAVLRAHTRSALFVVAAAALSLLFIGIHNAWDTVTHIVVTSSQGEVK